MKKIFLNLLTLSMIGTLSVSCQNDKKAKNEDSTKVSRERPLSKAEKIQDSTKRANALPVTANEIEQAKVDIPNFSNQEINDVFKEFNQLKENYEKALKSKNSALVRSIQDEYFDWATRASRLSMPLGEKEKQSFINYYQKLNRQWEIVERQAYTKKM